MGHSVNLHINGPREATPFAEAQHPANRPFLGKQRLKGSCRPAPWLGPSVGEAAGGATVQGADTGTRQVPRASLQWCLMGTGHQGPGQ